MKKHKWLLTGAAIALITFVLILAGMLNVNFGAVSAQNIMGYIIFSLVLGMIAAVLQRFALDFVLLFFIGGIGIGFFQMFRSFGDKSSGWGDLAGIAFLITYIIIGLLAGIFAQVYIWFVNKIKKNK